MKKLFIVLLFVLPISSFALDNTEYMVCDSGNGNDKEKMVMIKTTVGDKVTFAGLFNNLPADFCVSKGEIEDILLKNLKGLDLKKIEGACVSITSNSGDGDMLVLLKVSPGKYKVHNRSVMVEAPFSTEGEDLTCTQF